MDRSEVIMIAGKYVEAIEEKHHFEKLILFAKMNLYPLIRLYVKFLNTGKE